MWTTKDHWSVADGSKTQGAIREMAGFRSVHAFRGMLVWRTLF